MTQNSESPKITTITLDTKHMRAGASNLLINFTCTFNQVHSAWLAEKRQNQSDLTIVSSPTKRVNMMHVIIFQNHILDTTEPQKPPKAGDAQFTARHYTAPQLNNNFTTMLTAVSPNRLTEYTLYKVITHPKIPPYYKDF